MHNNYYAGKSVLHKALKIFVGSLCHLNFMYGESKEVFRFGIAYLFKMAEFPPWHIRLHVGANKMYKLTP